MSVDIKAVEFPENPNIPELRTGDTVSVHVKIKEGNRERIQEFKGTSPVYAPPRSEFHLHRSPPGQQRCGCERSFLLRSPRIDKVVVERHNQTRRSRLYFLRDRTGKSARLKQKFS